MNRKGFTLIELLIVISIIGLLASIVLVSFRDLRMRGRDARRIADLRTIQSMLEVYYGANGVYPAGDFTAMRGLIQGSPIGVLPPNDPTPAATYVYACDPAMATCQSYVMRALIEEVTNTALNNDVDGTVFTVDCGPAGAAAGACATGGDCVGTLGAYCVRL